MEVSMENYLALSLGIISIGLAIGINWYRNYQEKQTRTKNEKFFVDQIQENLKKMAQYFLDVETETKRNEEQSEDNDSMMRALHTFYLRNDQEMKDVVYQTKLYLPFWSSLNTQDKKDVNKILNIFSWLLYDYYPSSLPLSMREITVTNFRRAFIEKKQLMMDTTEHLLEKYSS